MQPNDNTDDDYRERVAISVQDMEPEQAQKLYDKLVSEAAK